MAGPHIHINYRVDDNPADVLRFVADLSQLYGSGRGGSWTLDLSDCQYLGPDAAALIHALWLRAGQLGAQKAVHFPRGPEKLLAFCTFSGLDHYIRKGKRPDPDHEKSETVPLNQFYSSASTVSEPVFRLLGRHLGGEISTELRDSLSACLQEIVQNIADHADSNIGGVSCSRYFANLHQVRVAVVDHGVTIPAKVRAADPAVGDDLRCLDRVLQGGFSSKSKAHNAGQGLNNLRLIVGNLRGSLLLISGGAAAVMTTSERTPRLSRLDRPFPGTGVFFMLPTMP